MSGTIFYRDDLGNLIPLNPIPYAHSVVTTTTDFGGQLSALDTTVQKALDTLDDHLHDERYVKRAGDNELTGNWDAGDYKITAKQFESDIPIGTAPLIVASTTLVSNLNADLLDGKEETAFLLQDCSRYIPNDTFIIGRNNADDGNVDMWKVNTSDQIEAGANIHLDTYSLGDGTGTLAFDGSGNLTASGDMTADKFIATEETQNTGVHKAVVLIKSNSSIVLRHLTKYWDGAAWQDSDSFGFGEFSLSSAVTSDSSAFGYRAGRGLTGMQCNAFGNHCMDYASGSYSCGFGNYAAYSNTGIFCNGFGVQALFSNQGARCGGFGYSALMYNKGDDCNGIGYNSLGRNRGDDCFGVGRDSLYFNLNDETIGIGKENLQYGEGDSNTALGAFAFSTFKSDVANAVTFDDSDIDVGNDRVTIVGHGLGGVGDIVLLQLTAVGGGVPGLGDGEIEQWEVIDADTLEVLTDTITGTGSDDGHTLTPQYRYTNSTAIGANAEPDASNQVFLGDSNVTQVKTYGSIDIASGQSYCIDGEEILTTGTVISDVKLGYLAGEDACEGATTQYENIYIGGGRDFAKNATANVFRNFILGVRNTAYRFGYSGAQVIYNTIIGAYSAFGVGDDAAAAGLYRYNTIAGSQAVMTGCGTTTSFEYNSIFGYYVLYSSFDDTTGGISCNLIVGNSALSNAGASITSGSVLGNTIFGPYAARGAMSSATADKDFEYNLIGGYKAGENWGASATTDQHRNILLGSHAGYGGDGSYKLIISSIEETTYADNIAKAIIYGEMNTTTADQTLFLHATTQIGVGGTNYCQIDADGKLSFAGTGCFTDGTGTLSFDGSGNLTLTGDMSAYTFIVTEEIEIATKQKYYALSTVGSDVLIRYQSKYWTGAAWADAHGIGFGFEALFNNSRANCTGAGYRSLYYNSGAKCTGAGSVSLYYNSGANCTGAGYGSLFYNSGEYSTGAGVYSLYYNSGDYCTSAGSVSLYYNSGDYCTGAGYQSLRYSDYNDNSAFGYNAWSTFHADAGSAQTFDAADVDTVNNRVTIVGHSFGAVGKKLYLYFTPAGAGVPGLTDGIDKWEVIDADTLECLNDTMTGAGVDNGHTLTPQYAWTNTTVIGANAEPDASNQIFLGDSNVTEVKTYGGVNIGSGKVYKIDGTQVVGAQQAAIADHGTTTGTDSDGEARTKINDILAALRAHGLIDT